MISPYQTFLRCLSSFAIPYFSRGEVVKSSCQTNSLFGFNADDIRLPSTADHFHPDVWDGYDFGSFTTTNSEPGTLETILEEKKKEVKAILLLASSDSFQELDLVDKIQRLGLAYQFEVEIQDVLNRTYHDDYTCFHNKIFDDNYGDLHLFLSGFVSVFKKFKDESGEFHANLVLDVVGMLSLYEASYLGFNGEDIMDDVMTFTTKHLQSIARDPTSPLASQVQHALRTPLHHRVERVLAMEYIKIYGDDITQNETLLEYAKLDYNFVQLLHRKEMDELSRWWKQININSKVPFHVRDRVVEAYAMINSFNFEPEFSLGRIHLTKIWCVLTILDDAHDVYGNLTELEPLCDALQRWDDVDLNELPNHMKEIYYEMSNLFKNGHFIGGPYLKKEVERERGIIITFVTCYMKEHGVSESEAIESLKMMCMRLWKDINQELLRINNPAPLGLHKIILNVTRNLVLYYGDGYTNSNGRTKDIITSILIDPFPI
ncbi:hypothetical protein ACHQM5_013396 [Ranunculus cassubicifolius]